MFRHWPIFISVFISVFISGLVYFDWKNTSRIIYVWNKYWLFDNFKENDHIREELTVLDLLVHLYM